nr:hypothetical protein [Tanacetum cinerariifolium]
MSKSDLLTELILNPQHIDEFDFNGETSLSEYDDEEQYNLYFNDLFPFSVIHLDDMKAKRDNDRAPLSPCKQRHPFLRYQGLEYTDVDIANFKERLERIYNREIHRSSLGEVFDTRGPLVREIILEFLSTLRFGEVLLDLDAPTTIQFQLGGAKRRLSWRQFILALGLHTGEEMESLDFARYQSKSERMIYGKGIYMIIRGVFLLMEIS